MKMAVKLIPTKDVKRSVGRWINKPSKYTDFFNEIKSMNTAWSVVVDIPKGREPKKFNAVLASALRNRKIRAPEGFRFSFCRSSNSQFSVSLVKKKA